MNVMFSRRTRPSEATKLIINAIASAKNTNALILTSGIGPGLRILLRLKNEISQKRLERELRKIEEKGYIKRHPHKAGDTYELSEKGRLVFMAHESTHAQKSKTDQSPKTWDGIWRIVIFDVQEDQRKERTLLRELLKRIGFIYLQQSVWVYPFPCDNQIVSIKERLGLSKNAVYIEANFIEGDAKIKRHFGIT